MDFDIILSVKPDIARNLEYKFEIMYFVLFLDLCKYYID